MNKNSKGVILALTPFTAGIVAGLLSWWLFPQVDVIARLALLTMGMLIITATNIVDVLLDDGGSISTQPASGDELVAMHDSLEDGGI